jgi:hypothetical protein
MSCTADLLHGSMHGHQLTLVHPVLQFVVPLHEPVTCAVPAVTHALLHQNLNSFVTPETSPLCDRIGTYHSAEAAARAYDAAAFMLHGAKARTNFHYSQEEVAQLSSMDHARQQVSAGAPCAPCHRQPM